MNHHKKISFAKQERSLFNKDLLNIFIVEVLKFPGALVSDESLISDFQCFGEVLSFKENGKVLVRQTFFKEKDAQKKFKKSLMLLTKMERESIKIITEVLEDREDLLLNEDVIKKTQEIFSIDITHIIDDKIVDIIFYISKNLSTEKRLHFKKNYN